VVEIYYCVKKTTVIHFMYGTLHFLDLEEFPDPRPSVLLSELNEKICMLFGFEVNEEERV
jgi:hypothetical protein